MPGAMGMSMQSQPMYSASPKYREKEKFEETFPQPMGTQMRQHQAATQKMRHSFEESQMSARSNMMLMHEHRSKYENHEDIEEQYGRAMLWSSGSLVLVAALGLLVSAGKA